MPSSHPERERLLEAILARAATDKAFRSGLLTDPKHTISDTFGVAIPDRYRMRFIEKDPDVDALIVLPDVESAEGEVSERDLDAVSGGTGGGGDDNDPW